MFRAWLFISICEVACLSLVASLAGVARNDAESRVQFDPAGRMKVLKDDHRHVPDSNQISEEWASDEVPTYEESQNVVRSALQSSAPRAIVRKRTEISPSAVEHQALIAMGSSLTAPKLPSHWSVFRGTSISMALLVGALGQQIYHKKTSPITFAVLSCMFFGMDNFFIAYAGSYLKEPSAHMALTFLFTGVISLILHTSLVLAYAPYTSQMRAMLGSTKAVLLFIVATAVCVVFAEVCACIGYSFNLPDSGPFQALTSCNVLIVGPFFYYFHGERMTKMQLVALSIMLSGVVGMTNITKWEVPHRDLLQGFMWLMFSMILYSISDITLRYSSLVGLHWIPRVLLMLFTMGFLGFPMSVLGHEVHGFAEFHKNPDLLVWPFLNAIAGVLGLLSCTIAFESPEAPCGILTAIVNANSAVLVVLNKVILGYDPSLPKLISAGLIMVGVCAFHLNQKIEQ